MTSFAIACPAGDDATHIKALAAHTLVKHHHSAADLRSASGVVDVLRWFESTGDTHLLWFVSTRPLLLPIGLNRLACVAADTAAGWLYTDYYDAKPDGTVALHPLVDYQPGSIRDDFDFGQVIVISRTAVAGVADAIARDAIATKFGGWYDLRLRAAEQ